MTYHRHLNAYISDAHLLAASNQTRLEKAIATMRQLTGDRRLVEVTITSWPPDSNGTQVLGECPLGLLSIAIHRMVFSNVRYPDAWFMPVMQQTTKLLYVLAHEWGHASDYRSTLAAAWQRKLSPGKLTLPANCRDFRESYAEAFTEWYLTRGTTTHKTTKWYARMNNWRSEW